MTVKAHSQEELSQCKEVQTLLDQTFLEEESKKETAELQPVVPTTTQ